VVRLVRAGIERIVINLAWLGSQIRDQLGDGTRYGAKIIYSDETPRALETAGGIFRALPYLSPGPFAVVNGDTYTDFPFETLVLDAGRDAHLVLVRNPSYLRGDFGIEQGEARNVAAELYTFSGIAVYRAAFFADCVDGVFPLKPLMLRSMAARRCSAQLYTGLWEDVGTPERLAALNEQSAP
jgi:MurNAc alpha-1-phosphate uridylyltransferase